jgi:hypothetical protein
MRRMMLLGAICFTTTALVAGNDVQPLNIKTGLWQVTMTNTIQGMGAPQTHTYKSCVTKENLHQYPFAEPENHCTYTVRSSTGSHMDVSGSCLPEEGGKADFKIQLDAADSEDVTGTGQLTLAGPQGALHGDYAGKSKWLSATCPADVH